MQARYALLSLPSPPTRYTTVFLHHSIPQHLPPSTFVRDSHVPTFSPLTVWMAYTRLPTNAHRRHCSKYELLPNSIQLCFRLTDLKGDPPSIVFFLLSLSSLLENWLKIELHGVFLLPMVSSIILGCCLPWLCSYLHLPIFLWCN
jgi:hypothetical protein